VSRGWTIDIAWIVLAVGLVAFNGFFVAAEFALIIGVLSERLGVKFEAPGVDKASGLLSSELGHFPRRGDVASHGGLGLEVLETDKNLATLMRVSRLEAGNHPE
jgi:CBS domain containing-hemolysin-like protein